MGRKIHGVQWAEKIHGVQWAEKSMGYSGQKNPWGTVGRKIHGVQWAEKIHGVQWAEKIHGVQWAEKSMGYSGQKKSMGYSGQKKSMGYSGQKNPWGTVGRKNPWGTVGRKIHGVQWAEKNPWGTMGRKIYGVQWAEKSMGYSGQKNPWGAVGSGGGFNCMERKRSRWKEMYHLALRGKARATKNRERKYNAHGNRTFGEGVAFLKDYLAQSEHLAHIFIRKDERSLDVRLQVFVRFRRIWKLKILKNRILIMVIGLSGVRFGL